MQSHTLGLYAAEYKQNKGCKVLFDPRAEFSNCISFSEGGGEGERKLGRNLGRLSKRTTPA